MAYFSATVRCLVIILVAVTASGCNEKQPDALFLKESDIQSSVDKQLPINGLVNVQIHIPDEIASLNGLFTERVVSDPLVEAQIELSRVEVSLVGNKAPLPGHVELLARPLIRTRLLGISIEEPLDITLLGGLRAEGENLYLNDIELKENGSFFLNNVVPNEYRNEFIQNLNDWFIAYFSAYPLMQFEAGSAYASLKLDGSSLVIEDDLVRFHP